MREALAAGSSPSRLRGDDLHRLYWGTRLPKAIDPAIHEVCAALAARLPGHTFFSHFTAGHLHGMPLSHRFALAEPIHLGVSAPARPLVAKRLIGHSMRLLPGDLGELDGLRLTSPERTWCDLAAWLTLEQLIAAGDALLSAANRKSTPARLAAAVEQYPSRRGVRIARAAVPLLSARSLSPAESILRVRIIQAGLPTPQQNLSIYSAEGRFLAMCDLAFPDFKVIVEYEGDHHRTDKAQWGKDIRRVLDLQDEDWITLRAWAPDLTNSAPLIARIRSTLTRRGWNGA